ncbi:outer membrane beta-barrel protein [Altererythrobacter sp. BO-6]|uniref:outer membrane beta-barrel protein n=1 Tax=Altererythrobacter sp. BO-6 TaxID=2604537 RepID=UPI0013E12982|nr:outer membrane beta-barrel protein [Altererythrobacter sp. BO-6]QIG53186.1 outer membrane beta-barrel protein [Altererythrobacter sp. BO-6]
MLMRSLPDHQAKKKTSDQSAMATGAANRKPRPKLPHLAIPSRTRRDLPALEESFTPIALAIMVIDLLLWASFFQRAIVGIAARLQIAWAALLRRTGYHVQGLSRDARRAKPGVILRAIDRLMQEVEDLAFVFCLALLPRRRSNGSAYKAISLRAASGPRRNRGLILRLAGFVCMSLVAPRLALAEAPEVVTPVELFDADPGEGVRVSPGFVLYPRATVDLTYDSNIYNDDEQKTEDGLASFRPALTLRSDFSRHEVSLEADADIRRYFDISDENSEQYRLNARALMELGYGINVRAIAGYQRGIEQRGTAGDVFFTDEPVVFHEKRAGFEIERSANRLGLVFAGNVLKRQYSNTTSGAAPVDLSTRDVNIRTARLRADLGMNAKTRIFGELSGNQIDYQLPVNPSRDSSGYAALVGVRHEVTALIDVEIGVGYIRQNFDNPSLSSVGELNYRLTASWTPMPQWRLTASASRVIDPSRSFEAPAVVATEFRVGGQRAIGDRLLVGAEAGYLDEEFRATPRNDKRFFASVSTNYRLADNIGLILTGSYRNQDGGEFGRSYKGAAGSIGLRASW